MPATTVNLSHMVDLAVGTPEVCEINVNVLHTLLHAMLKRLNIVDVQANLNDFHRDCLSDSMDREISVLSDDAEDDIGESSSSMPPPRPESRRATFPSNAIDRELAVLNDDAEDAISESFTPMPPPRPLKRRATLPSTAEDAISESFSPMPPPGRRATLPSTGRRISYHLPEIKVANMQEKLKSISSVPSNEHLLEKTRTCDQYEEKTMEEMWLNMQLVISRVETNEKGIAKYTSMIEDMTEKMQALRDEHKKQTDQIKRLNIGDLRKRFNAMDKSMNEINDRFITLPSTDDFAKSVTEADVEDALLAIRKDLESNLTSPDDCAQFVDHAESEDSLEGIGQDRENLQQPMEGVVLEMSSQTDPVPTRPTSSHDANLDKLCESHEALTRRVEKLETEVRKKLDEDALDGLNPPSELLEQLQELKEQVDAIKAEREQISEPLELLAPVNSPRSVTSAEDVPLQHKEEKHALAITDLQMKVSMLGDRLNVILDKTKLDRDAINNVDKEQKKKDKVEDILSVQVKSEPAGTPLERPKSAGYKYMDHDTQHANRAEFKKLNAYCDDLKANKADKTEVYQKADKRTLDNQLLVTQTKFDRKTKEIRKKIKDILDKMTINEEAWNQQCKVWSDDMDMKLDHSELEPLKKWLQSQLKSLNDKLKKQNQAPVDWADDDAAGIRRQLIQKYNCISCDRPVDIVPTGSLPSMITVSNHQALHPTRSSRPHIAFEMDQIRPLTKSDSTGITCTGIGRSQKAKMPESYPTAFTVQYGNDVGAIQKERNASNDYEIAKTADNSVTDRPCGGQHTTTYPHERLTKRSQQCNTIIIEGEETTVYPLYKDIQGADGNIYRGRMDPATQDPSSMQRKDKNPQQSQRRRKVRRVAKPSSDTMLHAPRPPPKNDSRPQAALTTVSLQQWPGHHTQHHATLPRVTE